MHSSHTKYTYPKKSNWKVEDIISLFLLIWVSKPKGIMIVIFQLLTTLLKKWQWINQANCWHSRDQCQFAEWLSIYYWEFESLYVHISIVNSYQIIIDSVSIGLKKHLIVLEFRHSTVLIFPWNWCAQKSRQHTWLGYQWRSKVECHILQKL